MNATASGKNFYKDPTSSRNVQLPISNAIKTMSVGSCKTTKNAQKRNYKTVLYKNAILKHAIMVSLAFEPYTKVSLCKDKSSEQAN